MDRFLSKLSVWVFKGVGWLMLRCDLIFPGDGCGWHAARSVLGMGLVVRTGRSMGCWGVGPSLAG